MRAAIIKGGFIDNLVIIDNLSDFPGAVAATNDMQIGDHWDGKTATRPAASGPVAMPREEMMSRVDDAVEARIAKSTRFSLAYQQREAAAIAYKDAGYTGDPTDWIKRFADNTGMPYKDAADLILTQAAGLRGALKSLEDLRMDKYLIKSAGTDADASTIFNQIISNITAVPIP
jgi:hypothetical protein